MPDRYVDDDIKSFILTHIDTIAQVEALLIVYSNVQSLWTVHDIAERIYTSDADAADTLNRLAKIGLLRLDGGRYSASEVAATVALVEKLRTTYSRHLIPVTNIIHAKPHRISSFANAFRIRKDR